MTRQSLTPNSSTSGGATTPAAKQANTVCLLGDSITNQNVDTTSQAGSVFYSPIGYFTVANVRLRHRLKLLLDTDNTPFGASSQGANDVISNGELAKAVASTASFAVVALGTVDIGNSRTYAQVVADLTTVYAALVASGKRVVACTIAPRYSDISATLTQRIRDVNAWIRSYVQTTPYMVLCDWHAHLLNPADGYSDLNFFYDTTHPDARGALVMGKVLADALDPIVPNLTVLGGEAGDTGNLLTNGMFVGDTSGLSTGWSQTTDASVTKVLTKVPRSDGVLGEWQQVEITVGTATGGVTLYQDITTGWSIGQTVQASIEFETSVVGMALKQQAQLVLTATGNTAFVGDLRFSSGILSDMSSYGERIPAGVLQTPPMVIPSGTTGLNFAVKSGAGTGLVRYARADLRIIA